MSKIQFLKAIHNCWGACGRTFEVVYDVKDTIFESNSQHGYGSFYFGTRCLRCQRYNFWKQFTTSAVTICLAWLLFTMSKIQFLKAIHNKSNWNNSAFWLFTMSKIQFLKAIHNFVQHIVFIQKLFTMSKIQFLKAIHNLL